MSDEDTRTPPAPKAKRPIDLLRDKHGGIQPPLKEMFNEQQRIRKALKQALRNGPKTVPQLADETKVPPPSVLWHMMAMRRYGEILDGPEQEGYLLYRLKGA